MSLEQLTQVYMPQPRLQTAPLQLMPLAGAGEREAEQRAYGFFKSAYVERLKVCDPLVKNLKTHSDGGKINCEVGNIEAVLLKAWRGASPETRQHYMSLGRQSAQTVHVTTGALARSLETIFPAPVVEPPANASASSAQAPAVSELELAIPSGGGGGWEYQDWHHKMDLDPAARDKMRAGVVKGLSEVLCEMTELAWGSAKEFEEKMLRIELFLYFDAASPSQYESIEQMRSKLRSLIRGKA